LVYRSKEIDVIPEEEKTAKETKLLNSSTEAFALDKARIIKSIDQMIKIDKTATNYPDPLGFKILENQKNSFLKDDNDEIKETDIQHLQYLRPTLHVFLSHIVKQYEVNLKLNFFFWIKKY
jgi:uncharacterized protein YsxB (DUF464 family)